MTKKDYINILTSKYTFRIEKNNKPKKFYITNSVDGQKIEIDKKTALEILFDPNIKYQTDYMFTRVVYSNFKNITAPTSL